MRKTRKRVMRAFTKWLTPLGLGWWEVNIHWYSKPKDILKLFQADREGDEVAAKLYADWRYGVASLSINLPAFRHMKQWKIERVIVHEFLHALVNETREGEIKHEERVVTSLTKAVFWIRDAAHNKDI